MRSSEVLVSRLLIGQHQRGQWGFDELQKSAFEPTDRFSVACGPFGKQNHGCSRVQFLHQKFDLRSQAMRVGSVHEKTPRYFANPTQDRFVSHFVRCDESNGANGRKHDDVPKASMVADPKRSVHRRSFELRAGLNIQDSNQFFGGLVQGLRLIGWSFAQKRSSAVAKKQK